MNIKHLKKEYVLAALYNSSKAQGMGIFQADNKAMTPTEAKQILDESPNKYFDYLKGRVMKIDLSTDEVNFRLYDRGLGEGAGERAVMGIGTTEAIRV